jgi:type III secretion protein HrpB1
MPTKLAFRTAAGSGANGELGTVDVSPFTNIRVVAYERVGGTTGVNLRLTITEDNGDNGKEWVADLDELSLTPRSEITRTYNTPGTMLTFFADKVDGNGAADVDVLVYGSWG